MAVAKNDVDEAMLAATKDIEEAKVAAREEVEAVSAANKLDVKAAMAVAKNDVDEAMLAATKDIEEAKVAAREEVEAVSAANKLDVKAAMAVAKNDVDEAMLAATKDIEEAKVAAREEVEAVSAANKLDVKAAMAVAKNDVDEAMLAATKDIEEAKVAAREEVEAVSAANKLDVKAAMAVAKNDVDEAMLAATKDIEEAKVAAREEVETSMASTKREISNAIIAAQTKVEEAKVAARDEIAAAMAANKLDVKAAMVAAKMDVEEAKDAAKIDAEESKVAAGEEIAAAMAAIKSDAKAAMVTAKADVEEAKISAKLDVEGAKDAARQEVETAMAATKLDVEAAMVAAKLNVEEARDAAKINVEEAKAEVMAATKIREAKLAAREDNPERRLRRSSLVSAGFPPGKKYHYFLSRKKEHSTLGRQPESLAMAIHDSQTLTGFVGFFDVDDLKTITPERLTADVRKSCAMVVVLHDETCASSWCQFEWKAAELAGIPVLCIVDANHACRTTVLEQLTSWSRPGVPTRSPAVVSNYSLRLRPASSLAGPVPVTCELTEHLRSSPTTAYAFDLRAHWLVPSRCAHASTCGRLQLQPTPSTCELIGWSRPGVPMRAPVVLTGWSRPGVPMRAPAVVSNYSGDLRAHLLVPSRCAYASTCGRLQLQRRPASSLVGPAPVCPCEHLRSSPTTAETCELTGWSRPGVPMRAPAVVSTYSGDLRPASSLVGPVPVCPCEHLRSSPTTAETFDLRAHGLVPSRSAHAVVSNYSLRPASSLVGPVPVCPCEHLRSSPTKLTCELTGWSRPGVPMRAPAVVSNYSGDLRAHWLVPSRCAHASTCGRLQLQLTPATCELIAWSRPGVPMRAPAVVSSYSGRLRAYFTFLLLPASAFLLL
ncbi:unnamed protein product [Polarella glacialis]|uniref:TIR domain-containing protein n=1 Tax=Polarella glacialis TaxID=89957 RepID=A0A813GGZ0_POLGL|nr:unnamed protein product [Polarella glacialis]